MKRDKIVIGSRESKLAVLQSEMVRDYIKEKNPDLEVEILTMKTTGDIILDRTLDKVGGKGLFVKELDKALIDGRSILSVHSLKDMPMEVPEELPLLAFGHSTSCNILDHTYTMQLQAAHIIFYSLPLSVEPDSLQSTVFVKTSPGIRIVKISIRKAQPTL